MLERRVGGCRWIKRRRWLSKHLGGLARTGEIVPMLRSCEGASAADEHECNDQQSDRHDARNEASRCDRAMIMSRVHSALVLSSENRRLVQRRPMKSLEPIQARG